MTRTEAVIMYGLGAWFALSAAIVIVLGAATLTGNTWRWLAARYTAWNTAPPVLTTGLAEAGDAIDSMISVVCEACVPWGKGPGTCTCPQDCRHGDCQGGFHTTLGGLSKSDVEWLRSEWEKR